MRALTLDEVEAVSGGGDEGIRIWFRKLVYSFYVSEGGGAIPSAAILGPGAAAAGAGKK